MSGENDLTPAQIDRILLKLAQKAGGLHDDATVSSSAISKVLLQDWPEADRPRALRDLIQWILQDLPEETRLTVETALWITDGSNVSPEFAKKVAVWTKSRGLFARLRDLEDHMPERLTDDGWNARRFSNPKRVPIRTLRRY